MNVTKGTAKVDDSDSDLEMWEEKKRDGAGADGEGAEDEEDPSEFYIKAAMERMQKAKEARLARGSSAVGDGGMHKSTTPGFDDDRGAPRVRYDRGAGAPGRQGTMLYERQKTQTTHPHKMISELVFTWRGDRVYHTTKLETLGIHPRGRDGRLHDNVHSGRSAPEGYMGKDKVYFEAWTPEEYEELQKKQDRERKLRETGGDWWTEKDTADDKDDGNGGQAAAAGAEVNTPSKEDDRIRVVFRARDMPPRNITVRKHSTVAQLIRAFRKVASLGEDKHIELRWDGEVLDHDTTVEEADIGDTDSVEVHIR
ncbi:hypothetical protein NUW58_g10409 [Xylaria curta]|uniref:Uncharacterized protein n=1 Tax=Xylaria curta TaxID=42375 RepID=A0ACC1MLQ6_9PEZI|nr:hypothetical protein NUW58_g10409 [Xylaria curta]